MDANLVWLNPSETWADIERFGHDSRLTRFISETGAIEMYISSTTRGPKALSKNLARISGFPILPPFYSIGFHYSKWEDTSADKVIEYS